MGKRKRRTRPIIIPRKKRKIVYKKQQEEEHVDYRTPRLQNIVSVINTQTKFDHASFSQVIENYEYFKHKFAAASLRFTMPGSGKRSTGLLYRTGKFIVVGSTSEFEAKFVATVYMNELGKIRERKFIRNTNKRSRYFYNDIKYVSKSSSMNCKKMKTSNTVCKCNLDPKRVCLDGIRNDNQESVKYSPEAFPGAIYRGKWATYLVFQSGSALILGLSNTDNLMKAYHELDEIINNSSKKKAVMDVFSRHVWELINNEEYEKASGNRQKLVKYVKKQRKQTAERLSKRNETRMLKRDEIKRNYSSRGGCGGGCSNSSSDNSNSCVDEGNFENRLTSYYSGGRYIKTDKRITDDGVIDDTVRETIGLDDFVPRVTHLLKKYNDF